MSTPKPRNRAPVPNLQNIDLHLLRVFLTIVRNGGFTAAQTELNIGQSTISGYMSKLETRLGLRLCERGRGGFALTEQGRIVYEATQNVFYQLEDFRTTIGEARNELFGTFRIGMVDAIAGMADDVFARILKRFAQRAPGITIDLRLGSPQGLIRGVLDGQYGAVAVPVFRLPAGIELIPINPINVQHLYCSKDHALFSRDDSEITSQELAETPFANRVHMEGWSHPSGQRFNTKALAVDMECLLTFVLTGKFISYLPHYYARKWVDLGTLRPMFVDRFSYHSNVSIAYRSNDNSNATQLLQECVHEALAEKPLA